MYVRVTEINSSMKKVYLESNVICRAQDSNLSGGDLRRLLDDEGFVPVIGLHVIYELARTFLNVENTDTAIRLFAIIKELEPEFSNQPGILMYQEANNCISGREIFPFLGGEEKQSTINEVLKLSAGNFDDRAKGFIKERDDNFQQDHVEVAKKNIAIFKISPPEKRLRTFEDIFEYYKNDLSTLLSYIFEDKFTNIQTSSIIEKIDKYPVISSRLRAELYLIYVYLVHKVVPANDKVDDHRHLIEAAYCDAFITNDRQLINNANKISPHLEVVKWDTLI